MYEPIPRRALEVVADKFFAYARERYSILLKRRAGFPREKWTDDPVLREWSFCNVFREDDRVTQWFRENIRGPLQDDPRVLMATIAFRWFNRIPAGEVIRNFVFSDWWHLDDWREELNKVRERDGVVITGSYMVKTPSKMSKIDGILQCLQKAYDRQDELVFVLSQPDLTLEKMWERLCTIDFMGQFTSYEVVSDLRYTRWLENADDILTWANPGPGCTAGLGQLFCGDEKTYNRHKEDDRKFMIFLMRRLLDCSLEEQYWPQAWPMWDMRTVEHSLCEYFKYFKALQGKRLKRRYKPYELPKVQSV